MNKLDRLISSLGKFAADYRHGNLLGLVALKINNESIGEKTLKELLAKLEAEKAARPRGM